MESEKLSPMSISISHHPDESFDIADATDDKVVVHHSCISATKQIHENAVEEDHDSSQSPIVHCLDSAHVIPPSSILGNSSETPKEALFDPFYPCHDRITFAPHSNKYGEAPLSNVVRRLDFSCAPDLLGDMNQLSKMDSPADNKDLLLEIGCGTIPDVIDPVQTENLVPSSPVGITDSFEFRTPVSAPFLHGVDQTCPGAPMKAKRSSSRFMNIPKEICRKLEF